MILLPQRHWGFTHELAHALLRRRDVRFRAVIWGRLSVIWDDRQRQAGADHTASPVDSAASAESGQSTDSATHPGTPSEPPWEKGDVVRAGDGQVYERNSRYIDPTFVWRDFTGDWRRDEHLPRPLVRLVPEPRTERRLLDASRDTERG